MSGENVYEPFGSHCVSLESGRYSCAICQWGTNFCEVASQWPTQRKTSSRSRLPSFCLNPFSPLSLLRETGWFFWISSRGHTRRSRSKWSHCVSGSLAVYAKLIIPAAPLCALISCSVGKLSYKPERGLPGSVMKRNLDPQRLNPFASLKTNLLGLIQKPPKLFFYFFYLTKVGAMSGGFFVPLCF